MPAAAASPIKVTLPSDVQSLHAMVLERDLLIDKLKLQIGVPLFSVRFRTIRGPWLLASWPPIGLQLVHPSNDLLIPDLSVVYP